MATHSSIKSRYRKWLHGFIALISILVYATFSGSDVVQAVQTWQWTELVDLKHALRLALPLATFILDGIVTADFKAVLVYRKRRNPLPGNEAFTLHGNRDARINMNALEDAHGPLPTDPAKQNQLWYKLSRETADRASVDEAHYAWLLARDLTSLSFTLLILTSVLATVTLAGWWKSTVVVGALALLYILLSQVAANKGIRFVTTVLAEYTSSLHGLEGAKSGHRQVEGQAATLRRNLHEELKEIKNRMGPRERRNQPLPCTALEQAVQEREFLSADEQSAVLAAMREVTAWNWEFDRLGARRITFPPFSTELKKSIQTVLECVSPHRSAGPS